MLAELVYFRNMLTQLHIRNYAIIKDIAIDFDRGLQALTGETGAGKSILMGALGLVLGDRADSAAISPDADKCVVEAVFVPGKTEAMEALFKKLDLDFESEIILRREINATGKSRAFVNDTPVTLQVLREVAGEMVDLHRQFDTLELSQKSFQVQMVDALAQSRKELSAYQESFAKWSKVKRDLAALRKLHAEQQAGQDYMEFQYKELEEAAFTENEIEEAESELELLDQAGAIKQALQQALVTLRDSDQNLVDQLRQVNQWLAPYCRLHQLEDVINRIQEAFVELKDIAGEVESVEESVEMNAGRLSLLQDRVNLGNRLMKKHQVQDTAALIALQSNLEAQLNRFAGYESEITELDKQEKIDFQQLMENGKLLSTKRRKIIRNFEEKVNGLLGKVGMPNARIRLQISPMENPDVSGLDEILLLFDSNNTGKFDTVDKIASGGELSRLMLILKSLVAGSMAMPTLIFDEIDSGIGGEAARQVGKILQQLAEKHQLIVITHQPQIAAKAEKHFQVFKQNVDNRILTQIKLLQKSERVDVIAQMLAGFNITDAAKKTALEMLEP